VPERTANVRFRAPVGAESLAGQLRRGGKIVTGPVLNNLHSPEWQRGYAHAIDEFIQWYCSGTLALDAEEANSQRDEAIDAISARSREDQPNEDQHV
jgi:hypothetical protein